MEAKISNVRAKGKAVGDVIRARQGEGTNGMTGHFLVKGPNVAPSHKSEQNLPFNRLPVENLKYR